MILQRIASPFFPIFTMMHGGWMENLSSSNLITKDTFYWQLNSIYFMLSSVTHPIGSFHLWWCTLQSFPSIFISCAQ